jgi:hypothetical protein
MQNVNTTSIRDAVALGCRTMQRIFNADDDDTPFFLTYARPEPRLAYDGMFAEPHVPGRHLNALLRAEEVAGVQLDESAVEKHARVAFATLSGSVALPQSRWEIGAPRNHFLPHNCRETFHALFALAAYRDSREALEHAERFIAAIDEFWTPSGGWDGARLELEHGVGFQEDSRSTVWGIGRAIGALVSLYRATGMEPALDLAQRVVDQAVSESFPPDGAFAVERATTHIHSTTCSLSGIAELAELTGDDALMERVCAFYENGLWAMRDEIGWSVEGLRQSGGGNPDTGEANNTGDILETALVLGRWGKAECFGDAERILRAHLLPSQLRDTSWVADPPNPDGIDGLRDVPDRILGAWGFPAPYGHAPVGLEPIMFHMDVVGGVVSSLCKAFENVVRREGDVRRVELLFSHEAHGLRVQSPYENDGTMLFTATSPGSVAVRIPSWVAPGEIHVDGADAAVEGGYLRIAEPPVGRELAVALPLEEHRLRLRHRTHDIRVRMRGDAVTAMESFGADLTFFDPWE